MRSVRVRLGRKSFLTGWRECFCKITLGRKGLQKVFTLAGWVEKVCVRALALWVTKNDMTYIIWGDYIGCEREIG